jgi:hypothetical protein
MKTNIEMARKAGGLGFVHDAGDAPIKWQFTPKELERFAALIRADERKKWEDQTDVEIHEAILDEREACAKVCDDMAFDWQKYVTTPSGTITACAAAIRARGQPKRPWVGLTHEERGAVLKSVPANNLGGEYYNKEITEIAFAVEAKLKELNT